MPVIKSAKKKLRQDKKRQLQNKGVKTLLKSFVKAAKLKKTEKAVRDAVQAADKAAKVGVIHKNKAARIKSTLAQLISGKSKEKAPATKTLEAKKSTTTKTKATEKKSPAKKTSKAKK